jgi:hypothetical protein
VFSRSAAEPHGIEAMGARMDALVRDVAAEKRAARSAQARFF